MLFLSKWAQCHPLTSRVLIAVGHLLVIINALVLGSLFFWSDFPPSTLAIGLLASTCGLAYLSYPSSRSRLTRSKYRRQKTSDFVMVLSYALLIAVSLNNYLVSDEASAFSIESEMHITVLNAAIGTPTVAPAPAVTPKKTVTKADRRQARRAQFKALKTQLKAWKKENKGQKKGGGVGKGLLTFLFILVAVGLALLLAALACSLACNGQGALSLLVLLGGLVGIVWLTVIAIKAIYKKGSPPAKST